MRILALFAWLALPFIGVAAYASEGMPHMIFSYTFHNNGDPNNPFRERMYTSCTYVGPYGPITVPAQGWRCPWVKFFREDEAQELRQRSQ
jgi:hypothetical protein